MSVKERSAPASTKAPAANAVVDYPSLLAKLGSKDRLNVERHIAACEAEPDPSHAQNQRRLLSIMGGLAPHSIKTHGQQAVQFFIADGKYRMQVFALQDQRDGIMAIYCKDVLEDATKAGVLNGPHEVGGHNNAYKIKGSTDTIRVDQLDGKTPNPSPFFKDMLGWNRRALRITIPATATKDQVGAVEKLLTLGAKSWVAAAS